MVTWQSAQYSPEIPPTLGLAARSATVPAPCPADFSNNRAIELISCRTRLGWPSTVEPGSTELTATRRAARRRANSLAQNCRRQFRLTIKYARLIEAAAVEIIEHNSFGRRVMYARVAAYHDDASAPAAKATGETFHKREVRDVMDKKLQLDAMTAPQGRRTR